ncbi:MAG: hypothetical protein HOP28_16525 [Gemmatimonadales bacterium]|nr:hypothetical protein [Gemmatimonadales bacterium]
MPADLPSPPATDLELFKLQEVREVLLHLHKVLLDRERIRYEGRHGRVADGLPLLRLVTREPAFAWLRSVSLLIVQLDERLAAREPLSAEEVKLLRGEVRTLMTPNESGDDFQRKYFAGLQEWPEAPPLHAEIKRLTAEP